MTDKEKRKAWFKKRSEEAKLAYAALMLFYPFFLEDLPCEKWKWINGYKEHYQISNFGRVKSFQKNKIKILKPILNRTGYLQILLYKYGERKSFQIHRLVAQAFIPNPENKPEVNHKYGVKLDCYFENLEWSTSSENSQHAYDMGLTKSGENHYKAKLTNEEIKWIRENYKPRDKEFGKTALADKFNVSLKTIFNVIHGRRYKNVE